jgi:hypothetical protein
MIQSAECRPNRCFADRDTQRECQVLATCNPRAVKLVPRTDLLAFEDLRRSNLGVLSFDNLVVSKPRLRAGRRGWPGNCLGNSRGARLGLDAND